MRLLSTAQHLTTIARLALCAYVLSLGLAIAAPLVNAPALQLICTSAGVKLVAEPGQDNEPPQASLDCPLCLAGLALPPQSATWQAADQRASAPLLARRTPHADTAPPAPWQARAPPSF